MIYRSQSKTESTGLYMLAQDKTKNKRDGECKQFAAIGRSISRAQPLYIKQSLASGFRRSGRLACFAQAYPVDAIMIH